MSFADPQSVNPGGGAVSLPRISTGTNTATYQSADGLLIFTPAITYAKNSRVRRVARVDHSKLAADPLTPALNRLFSTSVYLVIDSPAQGVGYSATDVLNVATGLLGNLTATSNTNLIKLIAGEN